MNGRVGSRNVCCTDVNIIGMCLNDEVAWINREHFASDLKGERVRSGTIEFCPTQLAVNRVYDI